MVNLSITPFEYLCPFKLIKNKTIIFQIIGKWNIKNNKNELYNNYLIGTLLGRNSSCYEEGFFKIENGMKYTPKKDGCLFLKFNFNEYSKYKITGNCNIIILFVDLIEPIFPLYEFLGFDDNINDIDLITYLNYLRQYPKLFINNFLLHLKGKKIYDELINELYNLNPCQYLIKNEFLSELSKIHCEKLVKANRFSLYDLLGRNVRMRAIDYYENINNNNINLNNQKELFHDLKECLGFVLNSNIYQNGFYLYLICDLLLDELIPSRRNRKILLNPSIKYYGYTIKQHKLCGNICVIIFSENKYDIEKYINE